MRKHGLSLPLEPLQISTWVLLGILVAEFYSIIIEGLQFIPSIIFGIVYGFLFLGVVYNGYRACKIDPGDKLSEEELENMRNDGGTTERSFCFLCQVLVHKGSRHCRYCDKCIYRFDHHCRWLNNCIGGKNYSNFIGLLFITLGLTLLQFLLSVLLIVTFYFKDSGSIFGITRNPDVHFANWTRKQYVVVVYVFAWLLLPFVGLLIQLIGFHMMLAYRGLTTFDYILKEQKLDRENKEQKALKELRNSQSRLSAVHQDTGLEMSHNCRSTSSASSGLKNRSLSFMSDKLKYITKTQNRDSSSFESELNIDSPETDQKTQSNAPCSFDSNVPKDDLFFSSTAEKDTESACQNV